VPRPEEWNIQVRCGNPRHIQRRVPSLLFGCAPVFNPNVVARPPVGEPRNISGGIHVVGRAEIDVRPDAAVAFFGQSLQIRGIGIHADADQNQISVDAASILQNYRLNLFCAFEFIDRRFQMKRHPIFFMKLVEHSADFRSKHFRKRDRLLRNHRDLKPSLSQTRGSLKSDETGSDDYGARRFLAGFGDGS